MYSLDAAAAPAGGIEMNLGDVKLIIDRCVAHDVPDAADLIERQAAQINHLQMALADTEALESETSARCLKQAAQIEMMREALTLIALDDCCTDPAPIAQKALVTTPDQALEQFAAKVREQCATVCEGQTEGFAATSAWDEAALSCARAIRAITEIPK